MLGWINDCVEKLVIEKYGVDTWHIIKQKAGCDVQDGGFLKLEHYTDKSSVDLAVAASEVSGLTVEQVLEAVGEFWVPYVQREGYENLMSCQGGNLKDWLTNINAIHQHLQATFPNKMSMPQFWCEDSTDGSGSLILHYFSSRGSLLAPVAKGIVSAQARNHFGVAIHMELIKTQGVDGANMTSWIITAQDPSEQWKLTCRQGTQELLQDSHVPVLKCPFTGMKTPMPRNASSHSLSTSNPDLSNIIVQCPDKCPSRKNSLVTAQTSCEITACSENSSESVVSEVEQSEVGLSATVTKSLIPYHVIMNESFTILQVGESLSRVLQCSDKDLLNREISQVFEITKPLELEWDWDWLRKLEDQTFILEPSLPSSEHLGLRFKTSIVLISNCPTQAMLIMAPDAGNLDELMEMNLTLSDLPVHGDYRDAVFLREHLSSQMNSALKMEKLSKSLAREKELLESLLPRHAAEGLRAGKAVEPMMHKHVTMFFSDVVGFTTICEKIYPWEVISMLNRLYCVMDYLAMKFNLFKVETIGDAYVCCSGLPQANKNHAEHVANFAIAVNHCCKQLLSPLGDEPIQLRIGIHTGSCASGVVGTTNPRYCVFGDTVNTTARHESSGEAGKIHCSRVTREELMKRAPEKFGLMERGHVEMKGKGKQLTYWLSGSENNELVNESALKQLDIEIQELLAKTNFDIQEQTRNAKKKLGLLEKVDDESTSCNFWGGKSESTTYNFLAGKTEQSSSVLQRAEVPVVQIRNDDVITIKHCPFSSNPESASTGNVSRVLEQQKTGGSTCRCQIM